MDYSTLILTEKEQSAFKKFNKSDSAILNKSDFQLLRTKGLVSGSLGGQPDWFDIPDSGECYLSQKGLELRTFQQMQRKEKCLENIRYAITTGIALIALIKSFLPEIHAGLALLLRLLTQQ